ncbi:LysE family translocator [Actinomadura barringtoniae]|uniref:LysE family translocator n=1 Tax=Actinomadura barringtoniae TaxID=1427535 RepID=A0A939TDW3_9ACTN|nr:LysE family translocator [Actinomadura barringtoniae]MBO2452710.1 LysE family translocator [Actinomadura barringtoniae]
MIPSNSLAFVGLAVLIVIAPGPDFAVVMKNCLMYGRKAGLATSLGVMTSLLVQGLAAAFGVAALVVKSAPAFNALKVVGACYLAYLGVQALRAARKGERVQGPSRGGRGFRQGFLSNITNPKVLALYFSLLPQFADSLPQVLFLAATHALIGLAWLLVVVLVLGRLRRVFERSRVRRGIEGVTGVGLLGLGVELIVMPGR